VAEELTGFIEVQDKG